MSVKLKLPIKIGDKTNLQTYAATLVSGEEQLLITREGTLHISVGDGTLRDIELGLTEEEAQNLLNPLTAKVEELLTGTVTVHDVVA